MIDVSQVTMYGNVLLIIFGALLVIGFLKGLIGGFLKTVVNLVLWIVLIVVIIKFAPMVGEKIAATGFIENLLTNLGDTEIVEFVLGFVGPTMYTIIAGLGMIIVGGIVIGIIGLILKAIFKKKNAISRLVAALFGLVFNGAIATVLFIIATSPLLFNGAQDHVDNTPLLATYQEAVVEPIQGLLQENGVPSSVEEITLVALKQEPTQENTTKLFRVLDLMKNSSNVSDKVLVKDENGNVIGVDKQEAKVLYSDIVFGAKIINDMDEGSTKDDLSNMLQGILSENLSQLVSEGQAVDTVTVDAQDYDAMNVYMANLGFKAELENTVNAIFVK